MQYAQRFYVAAVVGLRWKEFTRLTAKARALPVTLKYGGHISDGSNAACRAISAARGANVVLWQSSGARHFSSGVIPSLPVVRVHGVTSALNALRRWLVAQQSSSSQTPPTQAPGAQAVSAASSTP